MTLTQIKYIIAVDTYKSFANAAERCFVTQPTLSAQIQKLEFELGVQLFNRSTIPIETTKIGIVLIEQAKKIQRESEKIGELISIEHNQFSGDYRVAIIPTIASYIVPRLLNEISKSNDDIRIKIEELETSVIVDRLRKDELDIGILATPLNYDDIEGESLYFEPFMAYINKLHPFFNKKLIRGDELNIHDILLLKEGHCFRNHVINLCKKLNKRYFKYEEKKFTLETGNIDTLIELVDENYGITLLPELYVKNNKNINLENIKEFEKPVPLREVSIVYHKSFSRKRILDYIAEVIDNIIPENYRTNRGLLIKWK